jgi:hypothetical protein
VTCGLAYPNRTPPNATNMPIKMAGHDFPGVPSGFLSIRPIVSDVYEGARRCNTGDVSEVRRGRGVSQKVCSLSSEEHEGGSLKTLCSCSAGV